MRLTKSSRESYRQGRYPSRRRRVWGCCVGGVLAARPCRPAAAAPLPLPPSIVEGHRREGKIKRLDSSSAEVPRKPASCNATDGQGVARQTGQPPVRGSSVERNLPSHSRGPALRYCRAPPGAAGPGGAARTSTSARRTSDRCRRPWTGGEAARRRTPPRRRR